MTVRSEVGDLLIIIIILGLKHDNVIHISEESQVRTSSKLTDYSVLDCISNSVSGLRIMITITELKKYLLTSW